MVILIDDLDRCPPERVVSVLEAVHLLFDFEMFVVLIAVDTRWLEQSLRIRYRRLLGAQDGAEPADYLEKIIQIPLHLQPLDEELVRVMMAGLTGAPVPSEGVRADLPPASPPDPSHANERAERARRAATAPRPARPPLPVASLAISLAEATADGRDAPLVARRPARSSGSSTFTRLLKTRAADVAGFDTPRDGFGDHEVVAFFLAVVTGYPSVAGRVLGADAACDPMARLVDVVTTAAGRTPRLATRCAAGSTTTRATPRPRPPLRIVITRGRTLLLQPRSAALTAAAPAAAGLSFVDEFEPFVFGEVGVVLDVERGERKFAGEAAGGDPRAVDRPWTSAQPGVGLDLAPDGGGLEAARQDDDAGEEGPESQPCVAAPAVQVRPLGQLADGDEGDRELLAGEPVGEVCRGAAP